MDLVVRMPRIPKPGETLLGGHFKTFPGGKGANQAVAAARLGAQVSMIGCVGCDGFGKELLKALKNEGIDTENIAMLPDISTGVALIQVDEEGRNSISVASGANYELTADDVEKGFQSIGKFDVLIMQLETPIETVVHAAKLASINRATVILNPAPAQILDNGLLGLVDVLVPNEHEIGVILGGNELSYIDDCQNTRRCQELGIKNLIVTLGDKGAMVIDTAGKKSQIPAFKVKAVDTTAAGDCFVGALGVALCEGKSLREAAEFAGAAAALSVMHEGAQPSLPFRRDVEELLKERRC